jgi:general secretion pathway protein G
MRERKNMQSGRDKGFTLLEIMVVLAIVLILATISIGQYQHSVLHAREAALHSDLIVMRKAIDDYTLDKACGPSSLDDLVTNNYVGAIPPDPITRQRDWVTTEDDISISPEQTCNGISGVHSSSEDVSPFENIAYSAF